MKILKTWIVLGLAVGLLAAVLSVNAQEMPLGDALIEPEASAFLAVADEVIANAPTTYSFDSFTGGGGKVEWDALVDEILWRFGDLDAITYEQLLALYRTYAANPFASQTDTDDQLIPHLIEQWLIENPTSLYKKGQLTFDDFAFEVHSLWNGFSLRAVSAPFDNAALFSQGFSDHVADFIVIQDTDGRYRVPPLPERMFGHVIATDDFNSDGQLDFAYQTFSHMGNSFVSGALVVVTWDGTTFETIGNLSFRYGPDFDYYWNSAVSWQFARMDSDDQQELFGTQHFADNYGCDFIRLSFFDWQDDGTLAIANVQNNFPRTLNCLLRQADEHTWQGEYSDAIPLYEAALEQVTQPNALQVYAQVKLGMAYLINGQDEQADAAFTSLTAPYDDPNTQTWVNTLQAAHERDLRLLPMCQAVYLAALDRVDPYGLNGSIETYDGGFDRMSVGMAPPFRVNSVSCDLEAVLDSQLATATFTTDQPPDEQLEALGLTIADAVSADFDGDGDADWIVWGDAPGLDPILFVAEDGQYTATRLAGRGKGDPIFRTADLRVPDELVLYRAITLPDGNTALASVDAGIDRIADLECGGGCGGGPVYYCVGGDPVNFSSNRWGDLTLWRLQDGAFTPTLFAFLCPWATPADLLPGADGQVVDQFTAGDEFWLGGMESGIRPVTYTWDADLQTFLPPVQPTPTPTSSAPTPTETYSSEVEYSLGFSTYSRMRDAFNQRDFTSALTMLDVALDEPERRDEAYEPAFRYYRALTLEALDRPEEALAEYIAIYESAPDSAWGMLSQLHFEAVAQIGL